MSRVSLAVISAALLLSVLALGIAVAGRKVRDHADGTGETRGAEDASAAAALALRVAVLEREAGGAADLRAEIAALRVSLDELRHAQSASDAMSAEEPDIVALRALAAEYRQRIARQVQKRQKLRGHQQRLEVQAARRGITVADWRDELAAVTEVKARSDQIQGFRDFIEKYHGTDLAADATLTLAIFLSWKQPERPESERLLRELIADYPDAVDESGTRMVAHGLFRLSSALIERQAYDEVEDIIAELEEHYSDVKHPLGSNTYVNMTRVMLRRARKEESR